MELIKIEIISIMIGLFVSVFIILMGIIKDNIKYIKLGAGLTILFSILFLLIYIV